MKWRLLFFRVWLPPLLIALACAAAAAVAFGNDSNLIRHNHGLAILLLTRRLLWPLMTMSVLLCVALLGLVIANRRRAWWLIGLVPVVLLLGKRLTTKPTQHILEAPTFAAAEDSNNRLRGDDRVVGMILNAQAFAVPCDVLAVAPLIFIAEHEKRALLMFSRGGNRAIAVNVARELKAKDLEILAMPGDMPLVYNSRLGQFIVGETGKTVEQDKPIGFLNTLRTEKTTWSAWQTAHADTKVLIDPTADGLPHAPAPAAPSVSLIATTRPTVLPPGVVKNAPVNFKGNDQPLLLVRDSRGELHAFDRQVGADLFPKFSLQINRKLPESAMIDSDTASVWTIDGRAIAGPLKGQKLKELSIESDLDWPTLKFWEPGLSLANMDEP